MASNSDILPHVSRQVQKEEKIQRTRDLRTIQFYRYVFVYINLVGLKQVNLSLNIAVSSKSGYCRCLDQVVEILILTVKQRFHLNTEEAVAGWCFVKKSVLKSFPQVADKNLHRSFFFNKGSAFSPTFFRYFKVLRKQSGQDSLYRALSGSQFELDIYQTKLLKQIATGTILLIVTKIDRNGHHSIDSN